MIGISRAATETHVSDADGNRVKSTVGSVTTVYIAGLYEYQNGAVTKYYEGGAFRRTGYASDNGVFYTLQDHLHSTSVLLNQNGTVNGRNYFYPYGGNRGGSAFSSLTTKRFTGQYQESSLPGGEGLYYYNARWYDARLARFVSADTIVPQPHDPQHLNRYSYTLGNPLRYTDSTGHDVGCSGRDASECGGGGGSWSIGYGGGGGSSYFGYGWTTTGSSIPPASDVMNWLLSSEMLPNARSQTVAEIRFDNASAVLVGIAATTRYLKRGDVCCTETVIDYKEQAYQQWKGMVQTGARWDHKGVILQEYGEWSRGDDGYLYRFDIWSNIHYGYVGRAAGFTPFELKAGAGVAQIMDHTSQLSYWKTWFDDPYDQASIQIGIVLYDKYGLSVSPAIFMEVFKGYSQFLPRIGPTLEGGSAGSDVEERRHD